MPRFVWTYDNRVYANNIVNALMELKSGEKKKGRDISDKIGLVESSKSNQSKFRSIVTAIIKDWHIPIISDNHEGYKISENWDETHEYIKFLMIAMRSYQERIDAIEKAHTLYWGKKQKAFILKKFFKEVNEKPKRIHLLIKKEKKANPLLMKNQLSNKKEDDHA